ncbi:MAG: hypothetical protein Q9220_007165 [cf. Caloplaca sp. 1 TL-2023]
MYSTTHLSSEVVLPPKLDINVGAKSHIFQPPTPSAVEILQQSTFSSRNDTAAPHTSRKRPRPHEFSSNFTTTDFAAGGSWTLPSGYATPNAGSPVPFANSNYRLAGGLDTPTAALSSSLDFSDDNRSSAGVLARGAQSNQSRGISTIDSFPWMPAALPREANGRPRIYNQHVAHSSWGRTIFSVFDAAGKVWNFCKANAFQGFHAGKGPGYEWNNPSIHTSEESQQWHDMDEKTFGFCETHNHIPIPGRFPDEDFIEDYMSQDHMTPPRAAKKIQRSKGEGDMRDSWVMIGQTSIHSREGSPTRSSGRKMPPSSASGRRPMTRTGKRPILSAHRLSLTSHAGSPGMRSDRPASFAPSRSPATSPKRDSPGSVEMCRQAARIKRRELEEDANLKRLNQQLKAMIRQGKEALGTTVEVMDESDAGIDEGYIEGDPYDEREKG